MLHHNGAILRVFFPNAGFRLTGGPNGLMCLSPLTYCMTFHPSDKIFEKNDEYKKIIIFTMLRWGRRVQYILLDLKNCEHRRTDRNSEENVARFTREVNYPPPPI